MLWHIKRVSNLNGKVTLFPAEVLAEFVGTFKIRFWDGKEAITDFLPKPGTGKLSNRWYTEELVA